MNQIEKLYTLSGLTCDACLKLSTKRLMKDPRILDVKIESLSSGKAVITSNQSMVIADLQGLLAGTDYSIQEG